MTHQYNHELRLGRALHHMQSVEAEARRWLKEDPYRVTPQFDAQSGKQLHKVEVLVQPPRSLGLIIGDCLHNLRSCLDNLVYELAEAHLGSPLPKGVAERSAFPITPTPKQFKEERQRRVGGIAPGAQAVIEGLQPYHGGYEGASHPAASMSWHPLWLLRELSNFDKHRLPHLALLLPTASTYFFSQGGSGPASIEISREPIENGAILASYGPYPDQRSAEMDMHLDHAFGIGFGQNVPVPNWDVITILGRVREHIRLRVVPPLTPYLY